MKAVILAGGEGTRLRPVTYEIPKPLIPVQKQPIVNHLINFLSSHDFSEIGMIISVKHEEDFKMWYEHWENKTSCKITFFKETEPAGTFACLRIVEEWLGMETFVVANGDSLFDFDLEKLLKFHSQKKPIVSVALLQPTTTGNYVVGVVNQEQIIESLERRDVEPFSNFICSGFYIMEKEVFKYDNLQENFLLTERDIFPKIIGDRQLAGLKMESGRFFDCGTLESWEKAIKEW